MTITFTGTADINDDYTITNNTSSGTPNIIRIKAGDSEGTITINTVNDSDVELDEQIIAEITAISSGTVVAPSTAKVKLKILFISKLCKLMLLLMLIRYMKKHKMNLHLG